MTSRAIAAAFLIGSLPLGLGAAENARVTGRVVDTSGAVLPGVTVSLGPEGAAESQLLTVTDAAGAFSFEDVPPGAYVLTASLPGFDDAVVAVSVAEGVAPEPLRIVLSLGAYRETVTVREQAELVDVRQSSGEAKVTEHVIESAPLVDEQFQDTLPLLPSVVRGPDGLINMNGARSSQSGLLLNGANVTDPLTGDFALDLPLEAVDSVEVYQSVYSAEYGKVTSGITNVLTRSGSDEWKVTFNNFLPRFRFVDGHVQGIDAATPRLRVGGPIRRGKLWFSQALSYRFVRSRVDELKEMAAVGFAEEVLESFDAVTQIDYQPSSRHFLTWVFTLFPSNVDNVGINTLQPFHASPDLTTRGFNVSFAERSTLSSDAVVETLFSAQKFDLAVEPKRETASRLTVRGLRENYFNEIDRDSLRIALKQSFTKSFGPTSAEGHTLKVGYDLARTTYDGIDRGLPVDVLRANGTRAFRVEWVGNPEVGASNTEIAAFVQDGWQPSRRLRLDLGLRYDHERIAGEHHVAPRLGASYSPFADEKTVFKGAFGVFYDKVILSARDYESRQRRRLTFYDETGVSAIGPPLEFRNVVAGDLRMPRSVNWHVEVDRLINRHFMVRGRYGERHGDHELLVEPVEDGPGGPELRLASEGDSVSRELELTVRSRFGTASELFFSYVRAKAEGDLNAFESVFGNRRSPIILPNEYSLQPFDYRNRFLVWGVLELPRELTLSPVLDIHTGFPYTVVDELQRPVGARNRGGRFPRLVTLDLKITKIISLPTKKGWRAQVGVQLFNVLNRFNPRDIENNLGSPVFGSFANSVGLQVRGKFKLLF